MLEYSSAIEGQRLFIAVSDALYTNNVSIYYSTKGYVFQLFGSTIDYKCIKQLTITTSTIKAKLLALAHVCA